MSTNLLNFNLTSSELSENKTRVPLVMMFSTRIRPDLISFFAAALEDTLVLSSCVSVIRHLSAHKVYHRVYMDLRITLWDKWGEIQGAQHCLSFYVDWKSGPLSN